MRLYNFLNERLSKSIDIEEAKSLLEKYCSSALEQFSKGYMIWRASGSRDDTIIAEPKGGRRSAFTSNYYTMIINNHPMWNRFPKREVVCSGGSGGRASIHGGNLFVVFPFDKAKIGICPADDIWLAFENLQRVGIETMPELNSILEKIGISDDNWESMVKDLKNTGLEGISEIEVNLEDIDNNLYDFITEFMKPEDNDFDLKTIENYNIEWNEDVEVWTDSKCIMFNQDNLGFDFIESLVHDLV